MVLHSFVDRMIVYPFMAIFGIAYAVYYKTVKAATISPEKVHVLFNKK
jgi:hypothetical protein